VQGSGQIDEHAAQRPEDEIAMLELPAAEQPRPAQSGQHVFVGSPRIDSIAYLKLLLLAALLGLMSAVITFAFLGFVRLGHVLVWDRIERACGLSSPVFTMAVCSVGGLLVGVLVWIFGDHSGVFAEIMTEFGRTGRFKYREAPGMAITSLVSLIAGGSLGPEAALADACGSLGTLMSEKLKLDEKQTRSLGFSGIGSMLAAFITSPFAGALLGLESARTGVDYVWTLFPTLVASSFSTVAFVLLSGSFFHVLYRFSDYEPHLIDLLSAIPLGLIGALAGAIFIIGFDFLSKLMKPLNRHVVVRGLIGGMGLGIAGALLPLTLFSGGVETGEIIRRADEIGAAGLVGLALVKLLVTTLCLATGWKGGYIFPTLFAGVALGTAVHQLFPGIPEAVAVAGTAGGALVTTMKAPIFSAVFVMVLVQHETSPVIAIAVMAAALATARLPIKSTQPA
jgi:H+/Cl- antiporter ClcA